MKLLLTTLDNGCIKTNLALKYLYTVISDAPLDIEFKEFKDSKNDNEIYSDIVLEKYNVIYFHVNEGNDERTRSIISNVKKAMPTSVIVVGGMETTFDSYEYMKNNPGIDFIIRGEGELVFFNFVKSLVKYDFDFASIAGLAYRENGVININPLEASVRFEDIPFPYEKLEVSKGDVVGYESMRGAADRCSYSQILPDVRLRSLPVNRICSEIKYFIVRGVKEVHFVDRYFNYNPQKAYKIWEYIINNDNGDIKFFFDVDGDLIDEESCELLKTARKGLIEFNVDIESTNPEVLDAVGRKANIYQSLYNVSKLIGENTVNVNVNLKAGLPYETPKLFARAFDKVYGLGANRINVEILKMKRGTLLRENASRYGYLYTDKPPYEVLRNDYMKPSDIIRIKMLSDFLRTIETGFEDSIKKLRTDLRMKPYHLFSSIIEYMISNKLQYKMHDEKDYYRLIYAYALNSYDASGDTMQIPVLKQVLRSDMSKVMDDDEINDFIENGLEL